MKKIALFTLTISLFCFVSCSESEQTEKVTKEFRINGNCDVYSLGNKESARWSIVESPAWITPVKSDGDVTDDIKLYVESNSFAERNGVVIVKYSNGKTISTRVSQSTEQTKMSLQRAYAVGWSFDVRTYMDSRGLREQVFNTQKIHEYDGEMYTVENHTTSKTQYYFGESSQELSSDMTAKLKLDGKFNAFSLNLQGSFGKTAINNSKRIFSWIRGLYPQKMVYLFQFDMKYAVENDFLTADFAAMRNAIINNGGTDASIQRMIDLYGTHVVLLSYLGGSFDYHYSSVTEKVDQNLDVAAAINFGFQEKFGLKADMKYQNSFNKLSNEVIEKFSVLGGNSLTLTNDIASGNVNDALINQWLKSFSTVDKMELLHFQLEPLSDLFPIDIKQKIDNYTDRMYYKDIPVTRSAYK